MHLTVVLDWTYGIFPNISRVFIRSKYKDSKGSTDTLVQSKERRFIMSRIRHIAITTKDVDRLVKFYTTVFGLKIVPGRGTGTYLSDGHVNLAILPLEPERKSEGPYLKEGFYHFGFQVDDVDALRPISEEMGAISKIEKRPENREVEARVYDPDGNPVDLSKRGWPI
jgi:catechol 2,3-dioxygenase-like lactoylglutathione lyase family enzyme